MKRYIFILLSAVVALLGCEPQNTQQQNEVFFYFTPVEVTTTETTATITNRSYMTIDGLGRYGKATYYLEYAKMDDEEFVRGGDYSVLSDGYFMFTLTDLEPNTSYKARITIDGGEYGKKSCEPFPFTTKEAPKVASISCDAKAEAKGLFATIHLSNVAYLVNDEPQQIAFVKVEYTLTEANEWRYIEARGGSVKEGKIEFTIPQGGAEYLTENSDYTYRITITPQNSDYSAITTDKFSFKTTFAEVTAQFSALSLTYNDDGIRAEIKEVSVFYDGVAAEEFESKEPAIYTFYYRKKGASLWEEADTEFSNGGIKATIVTSLLMEDTTYEVKASVTAGTDKQVRETEVAEITTPKSEKPDTPISPEPPTGGDTSAIEGVWHLTEWRGVTPSFEVYMDITATGGITLYQRIENNYWDIYQSSAYIDAGVISGVYTDGTSWGASYSITLGDDRMIWVDSADSSDISVYTRSELPTHMPTAPTRAYTPQERFL